MTIKLSKAPLTKESVNKTDRSNDPADSNPGEITATTTLRLQTAQVDTAPLPPEQLYTRYQELVRKIVFKQLGEGFDRDSIIQDIFLKAIESWHRYDPQKSAPQTFLAVIARRQCIDMLRRRSVREKIASAAGGDMVDYQAAPPQNPASGAIYGELREKFQDAVKKLSPDQQQIINSVLAGKTLNQISKELEKPLGTVKSRLSRAYKTIREESPELEEVFLGKAA